MGYTKTFPEQGCSCLTTTVLKKRQRSERENAALLQPKKKTESVENGLFFSHSKNVLLGDRRTPALKCRFNISRMPFCLIDLEMAQMYCWMQSN